MYNSANLFFAYDVTEWYIICVIFETIQKLLADYENAHF